MHGSTVDAMASAVENAAVLLICLSSAYKASGNRRMEANYALQRKIPLVFLMLKTTTDLMVGAV